MKTMLHVLVLALSFIYAAQGQQSLVVNTWAYFDTFVGGDSPTPCRASADLTYGGPNQPTCGSRGFATPPTSQGRWGTPAGTFPSGLGWQGVAGLTVQTDRDFFLGQLTHFNFPITGAASGINLNIILQVKTLGGQTIESDTYPFTLVIDETPNSGQVQNCPYPSTVVCSDKISFQSSFILNKRFTVGGVQYTLSLQGFKESNQSSSSPVNYFISNENQQSNAFLFARFTAACPTSCANGGTVVIDSNNNCVCQCPANACPSPKIPTVNCSCICPNRTCLNGGSVNPTTCACNCPTCPAPRTVVGSDCSCSCPTTSCAAGVLNPSTCGCNCDALAPCATAGETRDSRCACACQITCPPNKIENPLTSRCECICRNTTCPNSYFTSNPNDCTCVCNRACHNSQVNTATCECGPCTAPWTKDGTGDCTVCGLNPNTCNANQVFDPTTCACLCPNYATLCDINAQPIGQIIDQNQPCACRNCTAGECVCGNGRIEPGEQCDSNSPCCQNCSFSIDPCDDGNACTINDVCNGLSDATTACRGDFNCLPSDECNIRSCNTTSGCISVPRPNGTPCRSLNLCHEQCVAGTCTVIDVQCPADNDTSDCFVPVCSNSTGQCAYVPVSGSSCSDGNACTTDDTCVSGTCVGTYLDCGVSSNLCVNRTCVAGTCFDVPFANGLPCNYDNNSCTVGDYCVVGQCYPGPLKSCNGTNACNYGACNATNGECFLGIIDDNRPCDDQNNCTMNDRCGGGSCSGTVDPVLAANDVACGALPATTPSSVNNNSAIIFSVAGGAALIGALAGLAFLLKRIRDKKLLDAETWNPDTFSSIGSNPLYKGSSKMVDNQLYEG